MTPHAWDVTAFDSFHERATVCLLVVSSTILAPPALRRKRASAWACRALRSLSDRYPESVVWAVIAVTSAIRVVVIWRSFFWQDDYIHAWTAWNAPASELIWQNWNGHCEPASFAIQWALTRVAPQQWWPAAIVLSVIAVATSVMLWLMLRRWGGSPVAAMLFAAWPATLVAQQWLSAGLETVPLVLMFVAGFLMARPTRLTPLWVGLLCAVAWLFHERAVYFLPVLAAVAVFYTGRLAWTANRWTWVVLACVTLVAVIPRIGDARPGADGGTSVPGSIWYAGPGSLLRSVLGWLPFDTHTVTPDDAGLWGVAFLVVWMSVLIAGLTLAPAKTALVASVTAGFLLVEVLSFVALRGGFAGAVLASDPRFTLITGTVLLAGLGTFALPMWTAVLAVLGCWSMLTYPQTPGRDWFRPLPPGVQLAATPSPPQMLGHFFFTTSGPLLELGTTRTLLQVGPEPPDFPEVSQDPRQVGMDSALTALTYTPLVVDPGRYCGVIPIPRLEAGVRVVRLDLRRPGLVNGVPVRAGLVWVFPPAGEVSVQAPCTDGVEVGIPGR